LPLDLPESLGVKPNGEFDLFMIDFVYLVDRADVIRRVANFGFSGDRGPHEQPAHPPRRSEWDDPRSARRPTRGPTTRSASSRATRPRSRAVTAARRVVWLARRRRPDHAEDGDDRRRDDGLRLRRRAASKRCGATAPSSSRTETRPRVARSTPAH